MIWKGYILDHWGKGSPSAAETAVLDLEVEILKEQERESQRAQEGQLEGQPLDDRLVIDGRPFNEDLDLTVPDQSIRTTSMAPSRLDSRVDWFKSSYVSNVLFIFVFRPCFKFDSCCKP